MKNSSGRTRRTKNRERIGKILLLISGLTLVAGMQIWLARMDRPTFSGLPLSEAGVEPEESVPDARPEISQSGSSVNLNRATLEQLESLPGIGEKLARRILDYRRENGPFASSDELMNVTGIGQKKFDTMKSRITVP